ncbi:MULTISPECIES: EspA/EspE family type VII secretion system effector [unclassified Mycobacterium]|uniref:EspA/EspE family type VII secretion system effector n=1 Tax=unclassified Mycobacterium TaxID=2642494 RepID=UPI0006DCA73E|nr:MULTISPECIES: EspA/EspE family type VII secretion system effector [unclassified Mycobacterium]OBG68459.1 hypothetical protein A5702_14215 [Mycobacterium sp. E3339]OBH83160.1 hypothetical protein A5680_12680 [Mycobacterium sp. E2989]
MSIFAQATKIIGTLAGIAGLGQQGAGLGLGLGDVTGGSFSAEYIAGSATSSAGSLGGIGASLAKAPLVNKYDAYVRGSAQRSIDFKNRMSGGRSGNQAAVKKGIQDFGKSVSLIQWTITIVELLELLTGFGPPDEGADLENGSQQFAELTEQLKAALPKDGWQGEGADAYAELGTQLQEIAVAMAKLDTDLATLVKDQAEWVVHMRFAFGLLKDALFVAFVIEMAMFMGVPPAGPLAAKIFAGTVCAIGIAAALGFLGNLAYWSVEYGNKAKALSDQYTALAAGTVQTGSPASAVVTTSEESSVSSFEAVSNSMSGMSGVSRVSAAPASSTGAAHRSDDEHAQPAAGVSAGAAPAPVTAGTPASPETPEATQPAAPTVTMPTVAQLAQMSGQSSKLSSQLSPHEAMFNRAMGPLQQLVETGELQSQDAAEEIQGEAEDAWAGAGAGSAGRAPVEVGAAGVDQAGESSPFGRRL